MQNAKGLTPKHQAFVDGIIAGKSATDAYQSVYGGARDACAVGGSRLLRKPKIAAAVEARQVKVAARADLTLQSHLDRLNELASMAAESEQFGPAITAEVSRGKASGFYVEKTETKHSGKVEVSVRFVREARKVTAG